MTTLDVPMRPASLGSRLNVDDVVRTAPGTLAGRYLRSFWQPVYHSADIAAGRAKPLHILGEYFTIFRGSGGDVHLIERRCPHRGMQLATGMVEGDAIRCFYHGWKFGGNGQCIEQPAEESRFADRICIKSYPVREYLGLVFAYLGDGDPPDFPLYPEYEHFEGMLEIDSYKRECNYFQNIDNSLDQSHLGFVHEVESVFGQVLAQALRAEESEWGVTYTYTYPDGEVFVSHFGMPNIFTVAALPTDPEIGWQESLFWWVPFDDVSHIQFGVHRVPIAGAAMARVRERREARRREIDIPHQQMAEDILCGRIDIHDVDPRHCDMVRLQDDVAQIGQGRIVDRGLEHLGAADVGVAMVRRLWRREVQAFSEGRPGTAWRRTPQLRPLGRGSKNMRLSGDPAEAVAPEIVDVRPLVEIDIQMKTFGALAP